jgi:hypothetical protein
MSLSGLLSMVPLEEVLEWVQCGAKSGSLELCNEHFQKTFYFARGQVIGMVSNEPADALAHRLRAAGLLSREQVDAVSQVQRRTGRKLIEVLQKTGAIDPADLEAAIDAQVREALLAMFLWTEGSFRFRDDSVPDEIPAAVSFEVTELGPEGEILRDQATRVWERLHGRTVPLRLAVEGCEIPIQSPLEEEVVGLLATPQTVFSLMISTRAGEAAILQVIDSLLDRQALRFEPAAEAEAREYIATSRVEQLRLSLAGGAVSDRSADRTSERAADPSLVAVLEPVVVPPPVRGTAKDILARARREMERKHYELALDLFRQAERADPQDGRLAMLRAGAESVYSEVLYRGELKPTARPTSIVSHDGLGSSGNLAARLLERADGDRTVRELVEGSGVPEIEALVALRDLKRNRFLEIFD